MLHCDLLKLAFIFCICATLKLTIYTLLSKIVHRDLAARNVLVGERDTCKVTDFGMARDVHQDHVYQKTTKARIHQLYTTGYHKITILCPLNRPKHVSEKEVNAFMHRER